MCVRCRIGWGVGWGFRVRICVCGVASVGESVGGSVCVYVCAVSHRLGSRLGVPCAYMCVRCRIGWGVGWGFRVRICVCGVASVGELVGGSVCVYVCAVSHRLGSWLGVPCAFMCVR